MPKTTIEFAIDDRDARRGFDRLQHELRETESGLQRTNRTARDTRGRFVAAGRGADVFTKSLGGARGLLTGLGVAVVTREILEFGAASVRAAGEMEGLKRALEAIEGENATRRLREFNEIAKLPGLNTPQIIQYSNALRSAGATAQEVDAIIVTFGQSIVGLGGNAYDTSRAMLQLTQAFGENKISQENFSTIKELIPNFNRLAQEVYNTDGSMDALNQTFKASGQTLGTFLLPLLARIREEIPAAPVDSYARSMDALGEEFQQFKIAIGTELLPVVSATARGLASMFDTMAKGVTTVGHFFDVVDEQHQALLNASESAREFSVRLADINTAAGQREAVGERIQQLYRLRAALRTEQSELSKSSQGYLQYAEQIRTVNNELDTLRNIQGTSQTNNRAQLVAQRTAALEKENAEIQRYTRLLANARAVAVGDTNPAIQQLERSLERSRATAAGFRREIELLTDGFRDLATDATPPTAPTGRTDDERERQTAARIAAARQAREVEVQGFLDAAAAGKAYADQLRNQIEFAKVGRIQAARDAREVEVQGFLDAAAAGKEYADQLREIITEQSRLTNEFPLGRDDGTRRRLPTYDERFQERTGDIDLRQQQIDAQIAAQGQRGTTTLGDIQVDAYQEGLAFIRQLRQNETTQAERELQQSLKQQERYYRQFANQTSRIFEGVATGRINSLSEVAKEFLTYSLRIVSRAVIENAILKNLDDTLTASKIANIAKVNAAQAAGAGGIGGAGRLANLFSGGGLALGVSALLFPQQSQNLISGIRGELKGFLDNVVDAPEVVVKANIQNHLRIGDNEAREISDMTADLREEYRA